MHPQEYDVVLIGTGISPLISAYHLNLQDKSVLILNPETDFFREKSEMSFDPFFLENPKDLVKDRLMRSTPLQAYEKLSLSFPGSLELWPSRLKKIRTKSFSGSKNQYHDPAAPHIRERSCVWVYSDQNASNPTFTDKWNVIEDMYIQAHDAGMSPDILEGLVAAKRFPGFSGQLDGELKAVLIPRLFDVDVKRYQSGILEYLYDRLGAQSMVTSAKEIKLTDDGLQYKGNDDSQIKIKVKEGIYYYWTPKLNFMIEEILSQFQVKDFAYPKGLRVWEHWKLVSRYEVEPESMGVFENMVVWPELDGSPENSNKLLLGVLMKGPLLSYKDLHQYTAGDYLSSSLSFEALNRLCHGFLGWDKFSVRELTPQVVFEWDKKNTETPFVYSIERSECEYRTAIVSFSDGPLLDVVQTSKATAESIL